MVYGIFVEIYKSLKNNRRTTLMMTITANNPFDLFFNQLRDLYSVEIQLYESMPDLIAMCTDEELLYLIVSHAHQNCDQIARISSIFDRHGVMPGDYECKAIAGLIDEATIHLEGVRCPQMRNLMMIAHCLRIEYYEMAAYEVTTLLSGRLGLMREPMILSDLLAEEKKMASALIQMEPALFEAANRMSATPLNAG